MSEVFGFKLLPDIFEAAGFLLRLVIGILLCYLLAQLIMKYGGEN